jgi:hypothetical protein
LLYLPGYAVRQLVQFEVINGMAVRGGDVMLGPVTHLPFMYGMPRHANVHSAVATASTSHLWPGGDIPFEIDGSVSDQKRAMIAQATLEMSQTELNIRPRNPADRDYIVFSEGGGGYGCSSYLGRLGGAQEVQVRECTTGGIKHELMHAAGFDHEQCRADRDNHVTIHWDEIPEEHRGAFEKLEGGQDIGPYDYDSIMHYSRTAFSRSGRDTITPHANVDIGQREDLSAGDRAAITQLYRFLPPGLPAGPALPGGLSLPGGLPIPAGVPTQWPQTLPQLPLPVLTPP